MSSRSKRSRSASKKDHEEDYNDDEKEVVTKKSKRNENVLLMKASGQTEDERRVLRQEFRAIQKRLTGAEGDEIENVEKDAFEKFRAENNHLFKKVRFTREAVLDGENVDLMSGRASKQVQKLISVPRYDATRLAHKLLTKCSDSERNSLDWNSFGKEVGSCFNAVPSRISFFHGPISVDYEPKVRKQVQRRKKNEEDDVEEETPEELHQKKGKDNNADSNKLSAVDEHMSVIKKTLTKKSHEEFERRFQQYEVMEDGSDEKKQYDKYLRKNGHDICAVKFLFNPKSFTQTVENIFHFSFMIKEGAAAISTTQQQDEIDGSSKVRPVVRPATLQNMENKKTHSKQAIVALNMKNWKQMCNHFHVDECDVPHRKIRKSIN